MIVHTNFAPDDPFGAIAEHGRGRIMPQIARDWFTENGVPPINLVKTWAGFYDLVFHDDVVFLDKGSFEFSRYREGKASPALTFVCWSEDGIAIDICAWQVSTGNIATWLGMTSMLGEENLSSPRLDGVLVVHETPLEWFKANRSGVFIIDKKRAAARLRDAGKLATASVDFGLALKKILSVRTPEIVVRQQPETAGAA